MTLKNGYAYAPEPGFYRSRFREALRKAREGAGLTQREAASSLDWSPSELVRIEAGSVGFSITDFEPWSYGVKNDDELMN